MTYTYQFYTYLALVADAVLIVFSIVLSATIILYMIIQQHLWNRRSRALLDIKRHVYELILSDGKVSQDKLARIAAESTPQQFLDIATNRNRDLIFFGESEQSAFKKHFLSPKKIRALKHLAGRSLNKWRRIEAIMALGQTGLGEAVDVMAKSLFDRDEDVSYFSIISLGCIKDEKSVKLLLKFLRQNPLSGPKVVSVLEGFPDSVVDDAAALLNDPNPAVRVWALRLISRFKKKAGDYLTSVERLAKDEIAEVRAAACDCLGKVGKTADKSILIDYLKDDSWLVRASAIKALSELLGDKSIPFVMALVSDPSLSVLENLKDVVIAHIDAAMPYIEKILYGTDMMAKKLSVEALEESGRLAVLLKDATGDDGGKKSEAIPLLSGMIKSGAHLGLEWTIAGFDGPSRKKILAAIRDIDNSAAEHIEKRLTEGLNEIPQI